MAKFFCGISGIECEVSYLPLSLTSREYAHPVFFTPQKKLLGLFSRFESGNMGDIESYLLYLAAFNSTDLVEFRVPAKYTPETPSIVAQNLEPLIDIIYKLNAIKVPSFQVPKFAITPDTANLKNTGIWITVWQQCLKSFLEGNKQRILLEDLQDIEDRVHRLILNPNAQPQKYANVLSVWACKAASFPVFQVSTIFGQMRLADYWMLIIRKCINDKAIFDIPKEDIAELLEHLEDNLELGTIYSTSLFKLLREGKDKQISYLGLGDMDLIDIDSPYQILGDDDSVEVANLSAAINSAPKEAPTRAQYKTEFEYQRARIKYMAAQRNSSNPPSSI